MEIIITICLVLLTINTAALLYITVAIFGALSTIKTSIPAIVYGEQQIIKTIEKVINERSLAKH